MGPAVSPAHIAQRRPHRYNVILAPSLPNTRIALVIRYVSWVGIIAHAGFVPLFAALGVPFLAAFNVVSVLLWIAAAQLNSNGRSTAAMWVLYGEVTAHAILAVLSLGWSSGFEYYLIPLIPFVMFNDRLRPWVVVVASMLVLLTFAVLQEVAPGAVLAPDPGKTEPLLPSLKHPGRPP